MSETAVVVQEKPSPLEVLLSNPDRLKDCPVETIERLYALDKDIRAEQAKREFAEAFNRVQLAMAPVRKTAWNQQTKSHYALSEHVMEMLDPLILEEGFSRSLSCADCPLEGSIRFMLTLRRGAHTEQHFIDGSPDYLGPKGVPNKTKIHGTFSSYTLAERHLVCKVFGVQLVADDDGNAGGGIGPGAEKITEDQVRDLQALRAEVKGDGPMLLALMNVERLEDIPKSEYSRAVQALEEKRK